MPRTGKEERMPLDTAVIDNLFDARADAVTLAAANGHRVDADCWEIDPDHAKHTGRCKNHGCAAQIILIRRSTADRLSRAGNALTQRCPVAA